MFSFDITQWVPKFILNDKNGYAIAKAIEAALNHMNATVQQGVDLISNFDTMPEWRLDELAWETNCLYDYGANIEAKRQWIKNAIPLYRLFGTPQAVYQYIGSYFDDIDLEESWIYDGDPFHFRVTVEGEWTPENEAWARRAIGTAKNVRSVLDSLRIGCKCFIGMTAEGEVRARFSYPLTGAGNWAGRWPQTNTLAVIDESAREAVEATGKPWAFPYPLTGTRPEINTMGVIDESARAGVDATGTPRPFPYPMTGTAPEINTMGMIDNSAIPSADADDTYAVIPYKLCGQDEI